MSDDSDFDDDSSTAYKVLIGIEWRGQVLFQPFAPRHDALCKFLLGEA